jgi:hypothetical protein
LKGDDFGGVVINGGGCGDMALFGGFFAVETFGLDFEGVFEDAAFGCSAFLGLSKVVGPVRSAGSGDSKGGRLLIGLSGLLDLFCLDSRDVLAALEVWSSDLPKLEGGAFALDEIGSGFNVTDFCAL